LDADAFSVLQLGRLVPRKGIDNVSAASCASAHHRQEAKLYIVGGNSEEADEIATPEISRLRAIPGTKGWPTASRSLDVADVRACTSSTAHATVRNHAVGTNRSHHAGGAMALRAPGHRRSRRRHPLNGVVERLSPVTLCARDATCACAAAGSSRF
jgi:hypothetical protein